MKKTIETTCFKIDKPNAKALILGFDKNGKSIHQSIYCGVKKRHFPMLITYNKSPSRFPLSKFGNGLNNDNRQLKIKYIVDFVEEYFIQNKIELWNIICNNGLFDIWLPEAPYKLFNDSKSNASKYRIVLLRIFEIEEEFYESDIIHTSARIDQIKEKSKLEVTIKRPIIEDLTFTKTKNLLENSINSYLSIKSQKSSHIDSYSNGKDKLRTIPTVMHANCGHYNHRLLEDCARLNFISAGQGDEEGRKPDTFGRQIRNLIVGDILAVYRNKVGYVGIAQVISDPMDIDNAILGGQKVTPQTFSPNSDMFDNHDNDYKEWLVEIRWLTNVHLGQEKASGACFGISLIRPVICSLDNQPILKHELEKSYSINFDKLLSNEESVYELHFIEENEELTFPEGKEKYILHKSKERNNELVRKAKELNFKKDNKLSCQICGFSFFDKYGEIGKGFIEAHHTFPISELKEETNTKIEDLAMLCSNCHRMLHRQRPWLTIEALKEMRC